MRDRTLVTVVIPTRDRPSLLARAVRSVLDQSYLGPIECIVVFDQSQPTPLPTMGAGPNRTVKVMMNSRSPGASGARNTGILAAHGEFIGFCDDDDEWLPHKLKSQLRLATEPPTSKVVGCGLQIVMGERVDNRIPSESTNHRDLLRSRCMELNPCTILVPRCVMNSVGLFDEAIPGGSAEDYDWLLRASHRYPIASVPSALVRIHWDRDSWFALRWEALACSLEYLVAKHPDFAEDPPGYARITGQIAMANAGAKDRRAARRWAARALGAHFVQPRAWLALLASFSLVSLDRVVQVTTRLGRGLI